MGTDLDKWDRLFVTGGGLLTEDAEVDDWSGRTLGRFELLEQIGVGGMASVYRARRIDEFEQQVAVKVLHGELANDELRQRFLRERQILADLNHPCIARIIDGGVFEERPYLVMELVEGQPIDAYCEQESLTPHGRLTLLRKVARAVQHAHSKGVVHQDLKPGNVMVTREGDPKLLDFGIAAVSGAAAPGEQRLFTPAYAAPEQFDNQPTSTATDVFQLGLLTSRLLCGRHPFAGPDDKLPKIRERVLQQEPDLSGLSSLPAPLRADLAFVLSRCLERDPEARYPSVAHMVADLTALEAGRPMASRAGQPVYQMRTFARRHAGLLTGAAALLAIGTIGAGILWQQMRDERERAAASSRNTQALSEVVTELVQSVDSMSGAADPVDDIIRESSFEVASATADQPEVQRRFVLASGKRSMELGRFGEMIALVEPLVKELENAEPSPPHFAEYLSLLGYARYRSGDLSGGLGELQRARDLQVAAKAPPAALAETLQRLALAKRRAARVAEARDDIAAALALLPVDDPTFALQRARARSQQGLILTALGDLNGAVAAYNESAALYENLPGDHTIRRAMTLGNLADTLRLQGQLQGAETNARQATALVESAGSGNPQLLATARTTLGNVLMAKEAHAEAGTLYKQALETYQQQLGGEHPRVALVAHNLATALRLGGQCDEAVQYYELAITIAEQRYPADHPELAESRRQRALCP